MDCLDGLETALIIPTLDRSWADVVSTVLKSREEHRKGREVNEFNLTEPSPDQDTVPTTSFGRVLFGQCPPPWVIIKRSKLLQGHDDKIINANIF